MRADCFRYKREIWCKFTRMEIRIEKYRPEFNQQVIEVWERSVRATHHFLKPADIDLYKSIVQSIDFTVFDVYCAFDRNEKLVGFLGVADQKLEMLFLAPECIGRGIGKKLMMFALTELEVNQVDVNEGNSEATAFYQKAGFKIYDRTPHDDQGKPYPILKMKLK